MKPEHDPQVLVARMHLRPHLCQLIADAGSDPEQIADALLAVGDVHSETRTEAIIRDGKPVVVLVHRAALTIRNAFPSQYDLAETAEATR